MVLLAIGFLPPVLERLQSELELEFITRKNLMVNENPSTGRQEVFAACSSVSVPNLIIMPQHP